MRRIAPKCVRTRRLINISGLAKMPRSPYFQGLNACRSGTKRGGVSAGGKLWSAGTIEDRIGAANSASRGAIGESVQVGNAACAAGAQHTDHGGPDGS